MMKNSPAEAIPHFERVRPVNIQTRFNLVRAYLQTKRTADALRVAAELSDQNKNDVQVHFSLGVLLASEKQYKAAQLELEKADALQPETFEILYNLGQDLLRTGDYSKAEVALRRALKLKPDSPETLYLLAQALTQSIASAGCTRSASPRAQDRAEEYGRHLPDGPGEHVSELL